MVEKLSGVYTDVDIGAFVPNQARSRGAVAIVGHQQSGSSLGATDFFSVANPKGRVYEFNSIVEAKGTIGNSGSSYDSWDVGTIGSGAVAGYDTRYNLIRGLELVYLGNPNARVYVSVLAGSGTVASATPPGTDEALALMMGIDDIEFITPAGLEFNQTYVTHATASDADANQAERVYVGGVSLNDAYSGSANSGAKQDVFDVSAYTTMQEEYGRAICVIGNASYQFKTGYVVGSNLEPAKEIGGNWLANFVAGYLSSITEDTSMLNSGIFGFLPVYNGAPKIWTNSELETNYDNSMLSIRFQASNSPQYYWEKAMTFVNKSNAWSRITRRRIVDRVTKDIRVILNTEKGKSNIVSRRRALKGRCDRALLDLVDAGMLIGSVKSTVFVQTGDSANGILRANVEFTPVGETEEIRLTVGVIL